MLEMCAVDASPATPPAIFLANGIVNIEKMHIRDKAT
jgi:hypothetical protein